MSYCVNCGVELAPSEKHCPLCGIEVINPRQPYQEDARRPYPPREDPMLARHNRHFIAAIVSISLAFPATVCLAIDRTYSGRLGWSLYVAGALTMLWFWIVPSFLYTKTSFLKVVVPVSFSLLAFLLLVERLQPQRGWFAPTALPLVLLVTVLASVLSVLASRKIISGFALPAAIVVAIGLMASGVDLVIKLYQTKAWLLTWSWFVLLPCLALAAAFLVIARRQKIRTEILKRLHL